MSSFPPGVQSSFSPSQYGATSAAETNNSFADYKVVTLPDPSGNPVKITPAYGPNFAYSDGAVPILVAFGDSSGRRFLFLPGETIERMVFQDVYVWAAAANGIGQQALVKWGAQVFRPSLRSLPFNATLDTTAFIHTPNDIGIPGTFGQSILGYSSDVLKREITPYPISNINIDAGGVYCFGVGNTSEEAEANFDLATQESGVIAAWGNFGQIDKTDRPFGYCLQYYPPSGSDLIAAHTATLHGAGPVFMCHNLAANLFFSTPYKIGVRTFSKTF